MYIHYKLHADRPYINVYAGRSRTGILAGSSCVSFLPTQVEISVTTLYTYHTKKNSEKNVIDKGVLEWERERDRGREREKERERERY